MPSMAISGSPEVPGGSIVPPGVVGVRVADTVWAVAHPVFVSRTLRMLHSFGSTMPFPLPPDTWTEAVLRLSTVGLAMPLRQALKVDPPPLVMVTVEVAVGVQCRAVREAETL